ncbi:MAG: osmotically inducible protein OsmC [Spirochaetae bacterium HGW-Spirochaetae-8]|jgi:putative redox protein|nr:MAG: osmotically inducible protein OsmC [Spirochaetae bacterium HGW-Spirochaetae-8]
MGSKTHIVAHYGVHSGKLVTDSGAAVALGHESGNFAPYELLLGGLSYCLFRTFEDIAQKMQLTYEGVDMHVDGEKREDKIATLEFCKVSLRAKGVVEQEKFKKAFDIATRYCSVYNTISKVATMSWEVQFV